MRTKALNINRYTKTKILMIEICPFVLVNIVRIFLTSVLRTLVKQLRVESVYFIKFLLLLIF